MADDQANEQQMDETVDKDGATLVLSEGEFIIYQIEAQEDCLRQWEAVDSQ